MFIWPNQIRLHNFREIIASLRRVGLLTFSLLFLEPVDMEEKFMKILIIFNSLSDFNVALWKRNSPKKSIWSMKHSQNISLSNYNCSCCPCSCFWRFMHKVMTSLYYAKSSITLLFHCPKETSPLSPRHFCFKSFWQKIFATHWKSLKAEDPKQVGHSLMFFASVAYQILLHSVTPVFLCWRTTNLAHFRFASQVDAMLKTNHDNFFIWLFICLILLFYVKIFIFSSQVIS